MEGANLTGCFEGWAGGEMRRAEQGELNELHSYRSYMRRIRTGPRDYGAEKRKAESGSKGTTGPRDYGTTDEDESESRKREKAAVKSARA